MSCLLYIFIFFSTIPQHPDPEALPAADNQPLLLGNEDVSNTIVVETSQPTTAATVQPNPQVAPR